MSDKGSIIDATTAATLRLVTYFIKTSDFLLFAIVNLSNVGCKQKANAVTLSAPFNYRGRTISLAAVGTTSKILGWLEQHFLNGKLALAN
jgi:hypothetical protein